MRFTHYTRYISSISCDPYTICTTLATTAQTISPSAGSRNPLLSKSCYQVGASSWAWLQPRRGGAPAHCLRFANPAEADGRQGRLEAGRLRTERTRIKREKPRGRFCMFWKHFGIHFGVQILPKSIPNRAGTIENRVREALLAPGVRRRCSMSALGVLGGIPVFVLGWFGVPESIPN